MTILVSWNIQYGKGVDGVVDLGRIVATALAGGPADVFCFQEVAVDFLDLGKAAGGDQVAELTGLLPGYTAVFGTPVDRLRPDGRRQRFGNLILSRLPVVDAVFQLLPRPAEPGVQHMPRGVTVAVVQTERGPLRVMTTHLEFHSARQRAAQVEGIRSFYAEAVANERAAPAQAYGPYRVLPPAVGSLLCGDFNFITAEPAYAALQGPHADGIETLVDAWVARYPGQPHAPTCGIHDRDQWAQGAHARDFLFVSEGLAGRIGALTVDVETAASDHQPMRIILN